MDIKSYKLLPLIFIIITSFYPLIVAVTKTVYFHKESDCNAYRHYVEPGDIYKVVWNGEVYPRMCNIRFKMSGIDTYKLCAKVTVFDLECERRGDGRRLLQFYWGIAMKQKAYDCYAQLPISYCNEEVLFMKLKPNWYDIRASNSQIRITVTSTLVSRYGDSSTTGSSSSGLIIGIVVILMSVLIIIFCVVVIKRRAAARENGRAVIIHRQGNNAFVATSNTGQPAQSNQQNPGEQQVPLVEYGAAGRTQPSGLDQLRYPAVSVGPTSHPGYYGEMHATAPPLNYYEGHTQLPSHVEGPSSQPPEFKNMTVPPPSYEDVMQNKKAY